MLLLVLDCSANIPKFCSRNVRKIIKWNVKKSLIENETIV